MTMTICLSPSLSVSMKYIYGNKTENQSVGLFICKVWRGRRQNTPMTTRGRGNVETLSTPKADTPTHSIGKSAL